PGLVIRPIADPALTREIFILQRKNRVLSLPAQTLYDLVLEKSKTFEAPRSGPT
ncbi:MAG: LysR family transcriptional regulator, partial [Pollutimonas bauzanensis]